MEFLSVDNLKSVTSIQHIPLTNGGKSVSDFVENFFTVAVEYIVRKSKFP